MRLYDFTATVLQDNPAKKAVWLEPEDGDQLWVPRSLLEMQPPERDGTCECTVPMWFAEREGMV